ncbi:MAG: RNA chaperone Hfq [Bryobacteraceae bacterium]|nr:RNA chaperone Hfq [Bryobacteraceae bacterium]MDW8379521.1 hypothetical protein [Bryobacterales bacterium]
METANRRPVRVAATEANKSKTQKKPVPPDQTNAENFYYVKQMQAKTPMVFHLRGGEVIHGTIEWYDKACLKVTRTDGPNLLIYKWAIVYMYKNEAAS